MIIQGDSGFPQWKYTLKSEGEDELVLTNLPDGWLDNGVEWRRESRGGIGRKSIVQLRFVKEGAEYIRAQIRKYGISHKVTLLIEQYSQEKYRWENWFVCQIKFEDSKDVNQPEFGYFECGLTELGIKQSITARQNNTFEISLNNQTNDYVKDIYVTDVANAWESLDYVATTVSEDNHVVVNEKKVSRLYPLIEIEQGDVLSPGIAFLNVLQMNKPFVKNTSASQFKINFSGKFESKIILRRNIMPPFLPPDKHKFRLIIGNQINLIVYSQEIEATLTDEGNNRYSADIEFEIPQSTFDLDAKDSMYFYVETDHAPCFFDVIIEKGVKKCELSFDFLGAPITKEYSFKAISAYDLAKQLLNNMHLPDSLIFKSRLMKNGAMKDIYITSGDAVRGYDNAVIKTKYKDFWDTMDRLFFIADFYNETNNEYSIESRDLAFNKDLYSGIDLGAVNDIECTPLKQMLYNVVKVGSPNKDYDAANGRYEFNTEYEFSAPPRNISPQTLNLITTYRTDSFGVHHARYQTVKSKDKKSDNNIFVIHAVMKTFKFNDKEITELTPYWAKPKENEIQTLRSGIFNLYLSPKRCLMRWERFFAGMLYQTNGVLKFESIAKTDAVLESQIDEEKGEIEERDSLLTNLTNPIYYPQAVTIYAGAIKDFNRKWGDKNTGYIYFTYQGTKYKCFVVEVESYKPSNSQQKWLVYMHPETPWNYPAKENNFITL